MAGDNFELPSDPNDLNRRKAAVEVAQLELELELARQHKRRAGELRIKRLEQQVEPRPMSAVVRAAIGLAPILAIVVPAWISVSQYIQTQERSREMSSAEVLVSLVNTLADSSVSKEEKIDQKVAAAIALSLFGDRVTELLVSYLNHGQTRRVWSAIENGLAKNADRSDHPEEVLISMINALVHLTERVERGKPKLVNPIDDFNALTSTLVGVTVRVHQFRAASHSVRACLGEIVNRLESSEHIQEGELQKIKVEVEAQELRLPEPGWVDRLTLVELPQCAMQ